MNINEQRTAAASYILSFYQEVESLTHNAVLYVNALYELEGTYTDIEKMSDEERQRVKQLTSECRYFAQRAIIKYQVIQQQLGEKAEKKVVLSTKELNKGFVINREALLSLVVDLNAALAASVMSSLLETSQELAGRLLDDRG